ncbi:acetyl-CoA synthetase-like protein [Neoconidiobolus thromboides FSU 785]|nr:acetyl-CoA synthetase-like protein [Neoconidiobolus thromboides FSU 785]
MVYIFAKQLSNTKQPGQTAIYLNVVDEQQVTQGKKYPKTVYELFTKVVQKIPNSNFLGTRETINNKLGDYKFETYSEVYNRVLNFSSGLSHLIQQYQLYPSTKSIKTIGIYSSNRSEWTISDLSISFRDCTTVGLYNTYGIEILSYVIEHSEIEILILSFDKLKFLIKNKINLYQIKLLICMDEVENDSDIFRWAESENVTLKFFTQVEKMGQLNPVSPTPPTPQSIYTICYTSGTTGYPKGVISTHFNYLGFLPSKREAFGDLTSALAYSYLPLAHCLERSNILYTIYCEGSIGFNSGSLLNFSDDIQVLKPTALAAVPRILLRIYDEVQKVIASKSDAGKLLKEAIDFKLNQFHLGNGVKSEKYDALFAPFRQALGGRVTFLGIGSAPISFEALNILKVVLSADICEGYGSTETAANISTAYRNDSDSGTVGPVHINLQLKLLDIPEMNYLSSDQPFPRGEICVKGFSVFEGYFKNEKATKEVLTKDGWYLTGDVGMIDDSGRLRIIDRKSNMFKLSHGEFIAPERIENQINRYELILQSFVYGKSTDSYLVALIIPDELHFLNWSKKRLNNDQLTLEEAVKDKKLNKLLLKEIQDSCKKEGLASFEIIQYIYIHPIPFSMENGFLNDTFKLRRKVVKEKFQLILDSFYK